MLPKMEKTIFKKFYDDSLTWIFLSHQLQEINPPLSLGRHNAAEVLVWETNNTKKDIMKNKGNVKKYH